MELNIALVVGFVIWCGISCALVMASEFRVRRLKADLTAYCSSYQRAQDGWLERNDKWKDRHNKLVQLIGEVATIGGYEPEDDKSWSRLSWKLNERQAMARAVAWDMKAQANDIQ